MNERKPLAANQDVEKHELAPMRLSASPKFLGQLWYLCSKIHCCLMSLKVLPKVLYNAKRLSNVRCLDGVGIFTFLISGDYESGSACEQDLVLALKTLSVTRMCEKEEVKGLFRLMKQVEDLKDAEKNRRKLEKAREKDTPK